ncbi:MAG: hypothetical protein ACFE8A_11755 [Candidatus Hodarchaeota archaeon]
MTSQAGSLLYLIKLFGTKLWLKNHHIINYNELNHFDNSNLQDIEVSEGTYDNFQYLLKQRK